MKTGKNFICDWNAVDWNFVYDWSNFDFQAIS